MTSGVIRRTRGAGSLASWQACVRAAESVVLPGMKFSTSTKTNTVPTNAPAPRCQGTNGPASFSAAYRRRPGCGVHEAHVLWPLHPPRGGNDLRWLRWHPHRQRLVLRGRCQMVEARSMAERQADRRRGTRADGCPPEEQRPRRRYGRRSDSCPRTRLRLRSEPVASRGACLGGALPRRAVDYAGSGRSDLRAWQEERYAFFLCDVCGKGTQAAAVASLVRYTVRTAALHDSAPEAVLSTLNAALLERYTSDPRCCTAVFGILESAGETVTVRLAAGGHPPTLILRRTAGPSTCPCLVRC